MQSKNIKALLSGLCIGTCLGAVTACGGVDEGDAASFPSYATYANADGLPDCIDENGLDLAEPATQEKALGRTVVDTGINVTNSYRMLGRNVSSYKFSTTAVCSAEAKEWIRLGISDLYNQAWARPNGELADIMQETTGTPNVTVECDQTDGCDERPGFPCNGVLGKAPFKDSDHPPTGCTTVATVGGTTYKTCSHTKVILWERTIRDMAKRWVADGNNKPGVDEVYLRRSAFYFVAMHEFAHNAGAEHSTVPKTSFYSQDPTGFLNLNDASVPVDGLLSSPRGMYYLNNCAWDRLRWTNIDAGSSGLGFVTLSLPDSRCNGRSDYH